MKLTPTQDRIYKVILQKIKANEFPIIMEGDPGCGKTTIIKELKKNKRDTSVIYIDNDSINHIDFLQENLNKVSDSVDKIDSSISLIRSIIRSVIDILYMLWISLCNTQKKSTKLGIDKKTYMFLSLANKYIKKNTNRIIIFDELNFWGNYSIKIIYKILFSDIFKSSFKYLSRAKFILLYSSKYNMPSFLSKIVEDNSINIIHVGNYTIKDILHFVSSIGIRKKIFDDIDNIKCLSLNSNISILLAIIRYIEKNNLSPHISSIIEDIEYAIDKYFEGETHIKETLKSTTIPFKNASLIEIIKLNEEIYQFSPEITKSLIIKLFLKNILCSTPDLLLTNSSIVKFIHDDYREYFKPKDKEETIKFFSTYAKILKSISPGDYRERAESHKYALEWDSYYICCVIDIIQHFATQENQKVHIENNPYRQYIELMQMAYHSFHNQRSSKALSVLEEVSRLSLPKEFYFEMDFLKFKILMVTGERNVFENVIIVMSEYCKIFEEEKEIYVRANFLLYLAYLYLGNNNEMEIVNKTMIQSIQKLSKNNDKYQYYLYSLYRRSLMLKTAYNAYLDSEMSVIYFSKKDFTKSLLFRKELFYSLINHADNCRYQGKYNEAYRFINRAYQIYALYPDELPNITLKNNYSIIAYENHKQSFEESLNQLCDIVEDVDIYATVESTYYIIYNNISCIYAMEGELDKALDAINKSFIIIDSAKDKISNHYFILLLNKAVIFLLLNQKENALEIIKQAKYLYTYNFSRISHSKRYNIIFEIAQRNIIFSSYHHLDEFIQENYPSKNVSVKHLTHPLFLWNMQYWSK